MTSNNDVWYNEIGERSSLPEIVRANRVWRLFEIMNDKKLKSYLPGEKFKWGVRGSMQEFEVLPDCKERNWSGHSVCPKHGEAFENNFSGQAHAHSYGYKCKFVWWCSGHGPEEVLSL